MSCIGEITIFQIIIPKIPEHSLSLLFNSFAIIESGAENSLQISLSAYLLSCTEKPQGKHAVLCNDSRADL